MQGLQELVEYRLGPGELENWILKPVFNLEQNSTVFRHSFIIISVHFSFLSMYM